MVRVNTSVATKQGIQNATYTYAPDAQASDSYAITLDPAPSAYATGQSFTFKANTANTGASSLNVNGLGAITLKKQHDQDTATGDIEAGSIVEVVYDGTNFQIISILASGTSDPTAIHTDGSGEIAGLTDKATPVDADVTVIEDSASTNAKKKLTWANIKATLKAYFDTLYPAETTTTVGSLINGATEKTTPVDADTTALIDSEASNVLKKLTWANIKATLKTYFDTLYPTATSTTTFTNKRITPRVSTEVSSATPTINTDNVDAHSITAQGADITSMTTNLSGTPTNFQKLLIRFKDDGTARAITWGASFEAKGVALPTTTVISKVLTVGFIYDTVTSKWGCVASAQEE